MVDRGRGGGHRTFNRGRRRGVSLGAPITINPSTSSIHISISESMIHMLHLQHQIILTPEYPPDPNCEHIVDHRPFIRAYKGEFQPTYGYSNIISDIIRTKFDEPTTSWLKVSVDLHDRWFGEFKQAIRVVFETKGSHILKSAMNKIRNGQDKGKWITTNEFQRPPTPWEVMEKTKKLKSRNGLMISLTNLL
ncbi:hypothetical protein HKD37_11G031962 [Glycine soja]